MILSHFGLPHEDGRESGGRKSVPRHLSLFVPRDVVGRARGRSGSGWFVDGVGREMQPSLSYHEIEDGRFSRF